MYGMGSSRFDLDNSIKTVMTACGMQELSPTILCLLNVAHKYVDSKRPRIRYAIEERIIHYLNNAAMPYINRPKKPGLLLW